MSKTPFVREMGVLDVELKARKDSQREKAFKWKFCSVKDLESAQIKNLYLAG